MDKEIDILKLAEKRQKLIDLKFGLTNFPGKLSISGRIQTVSIYFEELPEETKKLLIDLCDKQLEIVRKQIQEVSKNI